MEIKCSVAEIICLGFFFLLVTHSGLIPARMSLWRVHYAENLFPRAPVRAPKQKSCYLESFPVSSPVSSIKSSGKPLAFQDLIFLIYHKQDSVPTGVNGKTSANHSRNRIRPCEYSLPSGQGNRSSFVVGSSLAFLNYLYCLRQ